MPRATTINRAKVSIVIMKLEDCYNWTCSVYTDNVDTAIERIDDVESRVRKMFTKTRLKSGN